MIAFFFFFAYLIACFACTDDIVELSQADEDELVAVSFAGLYDLERGAYLSFAFGLNRADRHDQSTPRMASSNPSNPGLRAWEINAQP